MEKTLPDVCRGELHICPDGRNVWLEKHPLTLTRYEFDLLCLLARHPGRCLLRSRFIPTYGKKKSVYWNNAVQCVISSLRRKLKKYTDTEYIQTVWGIGYKFIVPEA